MVISDKNLFWKAAACRPLQRCPPGSGSGAESQAYPHGGGDGGSEPRAFVQNVRAQPGQRPTKILKLGELYEGYKVAQIQRGRVELSYTSPSGNVTTQILDINDAANRAARTAAKRR